MPSVRPTEISGSATIASRAAHAYLEAGIAADLVRQFAIVAAPLLAAGRFLSTDHLVQRHRVIIAKVAHPLALLIVRRDFARLGSVVRVHFGHALQRPSKLVASVHHHRARWSGIVTAAALAVVTVGVVAATTAALTATLARCARSMGWRRASSRGRGRTCSGGGRTCSGGSRSRRERQAKHRCGHCRRWHCALRRIDLNLQLGHLRCVTQHFRTHQPCGQAIQIR